VEDISFPTALFQTTQSVFPALPGEDFGGDLGGKLERATRDILHFEPYARDGALNHSILYPVTSIDNAGGQIRLKDDRPEIVWPNGGSEHIFDTINAELREHARAQNSRFVINPIWAAFGQHRLVTAHPLGGCPVGVDASTGEVDEYGRVFRSDGQLHNRLRVVDGALLPSALGVNPLLTISAMAERIAENLVAELAAGH
jgi:cholesterol oxidase